MNDVRSTEQACSAPLTETELTHVAGGTDGPGGPGDGNGVVPDLKATPVLF